MSKISPKQRYTQLREWLATRTTSSTGTKKTPRFSKADHYNKANNHYGGKKNY